MARAPRAESLSLALPPDVLSLAFGDLGERLAGERGPAFQWVTEGPATITRTIYRDQAGRFAKASSWHRSRAQLKGTGRRGRIVRERVEVPTTAERLGEKLAGKALTAALRGLGMGPVRVTVRGQYSATEGGPLRPWTVTGTTAAGMTAESLAAFVNSLTRLWLKERKSPPVILIERIELSRP